MNIRVQFMVTECLDQRNGAKYRKNKHAPQKKQEKKNCSYVSVISAKMGGGQGRNQGLLGIGVMACDN